MDIDGLVSILTHTDVIQYNQQSIEESLSPWKMLHGSQLMKCCSEMLTHSELTHAVLMLFMHRHDTVRRKAVCEWLFVWIVRASSTPLHDDVWPSPVIFIAHCLPAIVECYMCSMVDGELDVNCEACLLAVYNSSLTQWKRHNDAVASKTDMSYMIYSSKAETNTSTEVTLTKTALSAHETTLNPCRNSVVDRNDVVGTSDVESTHSNATTGLVLRHVLPQRRASVLTEVTRFYGRAVGAVGSSSRLYFCRAFTRILSRGTSFAISNDDHDSRRVPLAGNSDILLALIEPLRYCLHDADIETRIEARHALDALTSRSSFELLPKVLVMCHALKRDNERGMLDDQFRTGAVRTRRFRTQPTPSNLTVSHTMDVDPLTASDSVSSVDDVQNSDYATSDIHGESDVISKAAFDALGIGQMSEDARVVDVMKGEDAISMTNMAPKIPLTN